MESSNKKNKTDFQIGDGQVRRWLFCTGAVHLVVEFVQHTWMVSELALFFILSRETDRLGSLGSFPTVYGHGSRVSKFTDYDIVHRSHIYTFGGKGKVCLDHKNN